MNSSSSRLSRPSSGRKHKALAKAMLATVSKAIHVISIVYVKDTYLQQSSRRSNPWRLEITRLVVLLPPTDCIVSFLVAKVLMRCEPFCMVQITLVMPYLVDARKSVHSLVVTSPSRQVSRQSGAAHHGIRMPVRPSGNNSSSNTSG